MSECNHIWVADTWTRYGVIETYLCTECGCLLTRKDWIKYRKEKEQ